MKRERERVRERERERERERGRGGERERERERGRERDAATRNCAELTDHHEILCGTVWIVKTCPHCLDHPVSLKSH